MKLLKKDLPSKLQFFQHLVESDLAKMDDLIRELISDRSRLIIDITDYLISSGGKRLRPILTIICSKLLGDNKNNRHISLAASVELIHTATLLHDDVVDSSALRRGNQTANNKWGNKASILVGDFLLSQAFKLMVKDGSLPVLDILSSASAIIAEGEVMQISSISNIDTTMEGYLEIIESKTAKLFSAACQVGGIVASMPKELEENLRDFGSNLGIAFQIIDDVLDYSAKEQELGKSVGDDFREGKITLPVIFAYQNNNEQSREFLIKTMCHLDQQPEDLAKIIELLKSSGALDKSIEIAQNHLSLAAKTLESFPSSTAKDALTAILQYSLARSY